MRNNGFLASILRGVPILLNPIINKILIQKHNKSRCFPKKQKHEETPNFTRIF